MIQPGGRATAHVSGEGSPLALVSILAPLLLVWVVIDHFTIESKAFLHLALLTVAGFAVHYFLPLRYRLAFFAVLSMFGIGFVLGIVPAAWILGIGLGLIGICHLPVSLWMRVLLLAAIAIGLRVDARRLGAGAGAGARCGRFSGRCSCSG